MSFSLCSGSLGGPCTAKMGPKGQKVDKAGKKLAVGGWAFGGSKMAENRKKPHFRKKQSGCFRLKKKLGLQPQNQAFEPWSGAEQIFEFGRKWAWGWSRAGI